MVPGAGEHDWYLLHAIQPLADVSAQHAVDIKLRVIKKTIGSLEFRAVGRLRK